MRVPARGWFSLGLGMGAALGFWLLALGSWLEPFLIQASELSLLILPRFHLQPTNSRSFASLRMTNFKIGDRLRLLRQCKTFSVDFFENNIAASSEKSFANFFAQTYGFIAFASFAQR